MLVHLKLTTMIDPQAFDDLNHDMEEECYKQRQVLRERKERKIDALIEESKPARNWRRPPPPAGMLHQQLCPNTSGSPPPISNHQEFFPRVINTSNTAFNDEEVRLLGKGLKHALPPHNVEKAITNLVADLSIHPKVEVLAEQCTEAIQSTPIEPIPLPTKRAMKSISQKVKSNDLVVSKADKGNTVVIMNRDEYDRKINDFLNGNNANLVTGFNFSKFNATVRKAISMSTFIIPPLPERSPEGDEPHPP